uniref:Uncharacterized protein n=1 Tax=Arundo donax TaxID=35708 RepID=A0A0A9BIY4_ARUDO
MLPIAPKGLETGSYPPECSKILAFGE